MRNGSRAPELNSPGRGLHRHARRDRDRRDGRPRRRRHRPHLHRDAPRGGPPRVPRPHPRRPGRRPRRAGQRRPLDARGDGAHDPRARPRRRGRLRPRTRWRCCGWSSASSARGTRAAAPSPPTSAPRTRAPCSGRGCAPSSSTASRARPAGDPPGRRLPPRSAGPQGPALPRACAAPRRRRRGRAARATASPALPDVAAGALPGLHPGHPLRPGGGVPRPREGAARAARGRAAARRPRHGRHRGDARRHPHDRRAAPARRGRLRGRRHRHRRARRPAPERGGRGRDPVLPGPGHRRPVAARGRRGALRRALRPRARVRAGAGRRDGHDPRARIMAVPVVASFHTELSVYAGLRTGDPRIEAAAAMALAVFYGSADVVLSPSSAADATLRALGVADDEHRPLGPRRRRRPLRRPPPHPRPAPGREDGHVRGPAHAREGHRPARRRVPRRPRPGPASCTSSWRAAAPRRAALRERLGEHATFLGWLEGDDLARAYASADVFLFPSRTDTFGQVVLEAQASGLPVVAVDEGGPATLIADGVARASCGRPDPGSPGRIAVADLAADPAARERLARAALAAVRGPHVGAGVRAPRRRLPPAALATRRALAARLRHAARSDARPMSGSPSPSTTSSPRRSRAPRSSATGWTTTASTA